MSFFKAYDMRGTFGVDFDLETVYKVGRALPQVVKGGKWLVGRDCRTTSEAVRDALVRGLTEAGAQVTDLGLCTTPMVYFFTAEEDFDGSVMITASHNPPSDNGLKVSMRGALPVGYANGLDEVKRLVVEDCRRGALAASEKEADVLSDATRASRPREDLLTRYVAWQLKHSNIQAFKHLRIAVDCSNGMSSLLVHDLFPDAVIINDTLDGSFPNHSPNPLKDEAREQIAALVREKKLDCGVVFDGDADRCMFVDEHGDFVQPDYLVPIVARATLRGKLKCEVEVEKRSFANPLFTFNSQLQLPPKVIHDVRTSRGAIEELKRMGCELVMVPVGHAFAKPVLRESGAICGGELAGHYYFSEFHCCDSGILAALRILGEVAAAKSEGRTFSEMMRPISGVYANSGEMNFKVADKDAAIGRVLAAAAEKLPPEVSRSTMDGLRLEYAEGWVSVRKSNTEPYLRLLIECDTSERLSDWTRILTAAIG